MGRGRSAVGRVSDKGPARLGFSLGAGATGTNERRAPRCSC